jgi:hypothetical protein
MKIPTGTGKAMVYVKDVVERLRHNGSLDEISEHIPYDVFEEIEAVLTYGGMLYPDEPWKMADAGYHLSHAIDHINREREDTDGRDESGMHHISHAIVRLMFYLAKKLDSTEVDE